MKQVRSILTILILLAAGSARGAELWVSPTNLTNNAVTVGQGDVFDVFQVANTGTAPRVSMFYTVATTNTWLSVSPTSGNVQDDTNNVTVTYVTAGLTTAGWYTGRVDVVALGVRTQAVDVVLRVNNRPGVAWNAGSKVWTNEIMKDGSLGSTTVAVWNASGTPAGQMRYTVSVLDDPYAWVSVSPGSGVITGNQQVATNLVSYTTAGLVAGVYTATLKVTAVDAATEIPTTNGPLYMGLQLTVKGTPDLSVSVTNLSQTLLENLGETSYFSITNAGRLPHGSMTYTVTEVPAVDWVSVSPATGTITNQAAEITVTWDAGELTPAVYSANLMVSAAGTTTNIPLTLTVVSRTPHNWELPTVAGPMYIGQQVEATEGLWTNQARLTFSYQWERAATKADGSIESCGMTGTNYVITTADRGKYLRVKVTATDSNPSDHTPKSSATYSAWTNSAKVKALRADFNGDGITDLWFYDAVSGTWYMSFGTTDSGEGIFPGGSGMVAVPGDYDGDGYEDVGVYDPAHGMWHMLFLPRADYVYGSLFGGTEEEAAATPVPADYDGDGATDVGLYCMGYWAIFYSSLGSLGVVEPFADTWGEPVSGDWDGNGITEMGVYDDGIWMLRMGDGSVVEQEFGGGAGVLPAPADYDADSTTDLGVYDVGLNQWRWRESRTGFEQSVSFGSGGTAAIPGYYDHDPSNDWAQVFLYNNDFIVWEVKRTAEPTNYPYLYHGQSFQQSTDRWRVSW
ncbi:MAG: VCBS repeat-containing protein [Kiritimatiellaeota bacterium]|nr:VCBS repeat-containing protein [Kiritimatiellota bacterium]